jgi:hypothetical protein
MAITENELKATLGKNISEICTTGFTNNSLNHCAHFISHTLGIHSGYQCNGTTNRPGAGASVRCDEVYNRIANRGALGTTTPENGWIIFATSPGNMRGNQMGSAPKKHVGIYFNGKVYNYKNDIDKVVDDSLSHFHARLKTAYHDPNLALYYAVLA